MKKQEGLRERKKQQTRDALLKSAYALFKKKGYDTTSIEEIAARANFAPRTFFLHFTSKEELIFLGADKLLQSLDEAFEQRGTMSAVKAFKQWELATAIELRRTQNPEYETIRRELVPANKQLRSRLESILKSIEELLARELARDRGLDAPDIASRIVAAAVMSLFGALYEQGVERLSSQEVAAVVDDAAKQLKDIV